MSCPSITDMAGALKRIEVSSRRMLHRLLVSGVSKEDVPESVPDCEKPQRIFILRQDRIGDMVMTLPLLRRLRDIYPGIAICVLASEPNSVILKYEKDIDVIVFRKDPAGFISSLVRAWNFGPDAAVDMHMHDSTTSFIYALSSGARWRLHIDRENRLPFNIRVKAPQDGHIMDAFAGLLSGLGGKIGTDNLNREIALSIEETDFAEDFWRRSGYAPGDCVAVNTSAGGNNRVWGTDRFVHVCSCILELGLKPLVLCSPSDRSSAEAIFRSEPGILLSPVTQSVLHLAALIRGVRMLVSPDTAVVHIAASYGIPVVGMYLPFNPSLPKWYPWGVENETIIADDHLSLDSVTPEMVSKALRDLNAQTSGAGSVSSLSHENRRNCHYQN